MGVDQGTDAMDGVGDELVVEHYSRGDLLPNLLAALVEAGHDPDALDPDALGPVEELHTFGRLATTALADAVAISCDDHVLDVGSGLGGPARVLARHYGCRVTGIDLTRELCEVAYDLNRRVGLAHRIDVHHGDALDLPFDDGTFDVAWTQHASMNIADKATLFAEMHRVTVEGGRLAFFDILAGPEQPIHVPVPWAQDHTVSHLATPEETRQVVTDAGFEIRQWEDLTEPAVTFFSGLASAPPRASPLGLDLFIPDMAVKGANLLRNAREGRVVLVRCVADAR